jgi:hypothetical protein
VFEENGTYTNRKGTYTVLAINGPKMTVRYEDGTEADLRVNIQERIWENILAEREAAAARARKRTTSQGTNYYIKTLSLDEDDLGIPGLRQRVAASGVETHLVPGDRLIYFGVEPMVFFAVVTVTTAPKRTLAADYMFGVDPDTEIFLYPIDVDAQILSVDAAIGVDSAELESLPNHRAALREPDQFLAINEDDFELLAELITEIDADDEDEDDEDDLDDEEDILELDA